MTLNIEVTIYTVLFGPTALTCIGLFIYYYLIKNFWKWSDLNDKCAQRTVFTCILFYIIAIIISFVGLILFLIDGWRQPAETTYFAFLVVYTLSLFLLIYVWIQRLQITFAGSVYALSPKTIKILNIAFLLIVIIGLITAAIFLATDDDREDAITYILYAGISLFMVLF